MQYKSRQYAQILRAAGVPVHAASTTGFFESMEIRDMLALLRVLDNQQQDIPLAAVLRSPLSGLAEQEDCLARIRLAYPNTQKVPFHQAVVRYARERDDELAAHLKAFLRELQEWRRLAHQRPLAELIWQIYDSTGYLAFCGGMEDGQQRVANLIDFHERARQFGTFQRQGLGRFMQFLDSLAEQSDLGQPSVASEADDVVRVMSIHRSKGLEFPVVIVPDLGKKHNLQDAGGSILVDRDVGIGLMVADEVKRVRYPSLAHVVVQDRIRRQTLAEEMRVLYVAMTRPREHLILVGTAGESAAEKWRNQWSSHIGRFPSERILAGKSMLDWLGPAAAAMEGAKAMHRIEIKAHSPQEVEQWAVKAERRAKLTDTQIRMAQLEPLLPAPAEDAKADQIRDRLTNVYPYLHFTKLAASESVGGLTKSGRLAPAGSGAPRESTVAFDSELASPRCVLGTFKPSPTDIGSATHLILEHLDFARACDAADLRQQTSDLVTKKLLAAELADTVDLDSILWLMTTPIGQLLRRNAPRLRRELPVYFPLPTVGSTDPLDRLMLRGRVDVLIPDEKSSVIVDFKTDQVTPQTVDARADFYRPQLNQYRIALTSIVGEPIKSALLVFLAPRLVKEV
jgi:ATP-dependent helicase/nuclease subunit A